MDISIFTKKDEKPTEKELPAVLKHTFKIWIELKDFVLEKYPGALEEWNFPGAKYGWSFRIKDKKRAIIYFLPRDGFFKVAFVFGQKAMNEILAGTVSEQIKTELQNARIYAEGRGIHIEVKEGSNVKDIYRLVEIKLAN